MRTPLNAAFLGLKVLEMELRKVIQGVNTASLDPELEIVQDVKSSIDSAIQILNDLLDFDKVCSY